MNLNHEQIAAIFNEWARQVAADKGSFGVVLDESGAPPAGYGESCAKHFERIANDITVPQEHIIYPSEGYGVMVAALAKPGDEILESLTTDDCHTLHMVVGISGEAGELLDAIKKQVIYRKPLDRANVIEELGDLEFYMEGLRQGLGITREETIAQNVAKLSKRYANLIYSDKDAQERKDKQ